MRLSQGPHVALGVAEISTPEQVRTAFLELTKQYHPAKFGRLSPEVQKMSNEVFLGIKTAHEQLMRTSGSSSRPRAVGTHHSGGVPVAHADPTGSSSIRQSGQVPTVRATGQLPPLRSGAFTPPTQPPQPSSAFNPGTQPPGRARVSSQPSQPVARVTPAMGVPVQRSPSTSAPVRNTPPAGITVPRTQTPSRPPLTRPVTPTARPVTPTGRPVTPTSSAPRTPADPGTLRYSGTPTQPQRTAPVFDERTALNEALTLLNRREWTAGRQALHALAARVPQSRQYRALLCYARGQEAFAAGKPDDAAMEYQRALQLDPELLQAKQALAELKRR